MLIEVLRMGKSLIKFETLSRRNIKMQLLLISLSIYILSLNLHNFKIPNLSKLIPDTKGLETVIRN